MISENLIQSTHTVVSSSDGSITSPGDFGNMFFAGMPAMTGASPSMFQQSGWLGNYGQLNAHPFTLFVNGKPMTHTCNGNGGSDCTCGGSCSDNSSKQIINPVELKQNENYLNPELVIPQNPSLPNSPTILCRDKPVPDFPNIPWKDSACYVTSVDGCKVKICFCWRIIPNPFHFAPLIDYLITSTQILQPTCTASPLRIFIDAGKQIVLDDPANLGSKVAILPCTSGQTELFRFSRTTCLQWRIDILKGLIIEICNTSAWCLQIFTVCLNKAGNKIVEQLGPADIFGQSNCQSFNPAVGWPANTCVSFECLNI